MTMSRSRRAADVMRPAVLAACALALATVATAAPKKKLPDEIWMRPDLAGIHLESIAMLPVVTYDNGLEAEKTVALGVGAALRNSGHRWMSATTVRELARGDAAAEEQLHQAREGVLKDGRVDSLLAPALCARLRVDAVLTVRVEAWERRKMEWNEAGKPSTTIHLRAALVDSLGRKLWEAVGRETGEGPYNDPNAATLGVKSSSLNMEPMNNQGGPPEYMDVLTRITTRWGPLFPVKGAPAPAGAAPKTP
jgi:hypothetical protein